MKISKKGECRSVCPLANALDILGDRWTLLIIRDMMFMGKHEYREFAGGPEKIATNILADRLKGLMCMGIIQYLPHPGHKSKKNYYLTEKGKALLPLLVEMVIWGGTYFAAPDMPKDRFNRLKRAPGKFMKGRLEELAKWEKKHIPLRA